MSTKKAEEAIINEKLIQARLDCEWSQADVADRIGTTHISVSRWERGIAFPTPYFRKKLCQLYAKSELELGLAKGNTNNKKEPLHEKSNGKQIPSSHPLWSMPYNQSPFFTGREPILQDIHDKFSTNKARLLTLAISGLGGVGKTLTAIEYAYRHRNEYHAVFWTNAENYHTLASDFERMAGKSILNLPEQGEQNQELIIAAVKQWFCTHDGWLLILDNADDLTEIYTFFPRGGHGCILLTTRDQALGDIVDYQIYIEKMEPDEAALFLLYRTRTLPKNASLDVIGASEQEYAKDIAEVLDYLPLALDQAGAYIDETKCSFSEYLSLYASQRKILLKRRSRLATRYRETVATTWSISFQKIERANPISADLLRFFAFLHSDAIPEEIVVACLQDLDPLVHQEDVSLTLNQALAELIKYSLVQRYTDHQVFSIHRLVQIVLKDEMGKEKQREWAERTIRVISQTFPSADTTPIVLCERYFSHAQACATLIDQWGVINLEAAKLLQSIGTYSISRSQLSQTQQYLQQALTLYESILQQDTIEVADCIYNLAITFEFQGNITEAEALHLKAHTLYEQLLKPDDPKHIEGLNSLVLFYVKQYRLHEAEQVLEQIAAITVKMQEQDLSMVKQTTHMQAIALLAKGQFAEAEQLLIQALSMNEQLRGHNHPSQVSILNSIVFLYMEQGKFLEAEPLCQRILAILETDVVPHHHLVACHLTNLATIYQRRGKFSEAEGMYQRALRIREETQGPEHPEVVNILNNLGLLYRRQERFVEAEEHYTKALAIADKAYERDLPTVAYCLTNLAFLYQLQGKYDVIEPLLQRALTIFSSTFGPDHPEMIYGFNNLAAFYTSQGNYAQAELLYQQALALIEKNGIAYANIHLVLQGYTYILREMGREEEATAIETRIYEKS